MIISENNFVTFNLAYANVASQNYTCDNSSTAGELTKSIMFPYQDLDVSFGGTTRYMTTGQAPNRKFVIEFCDVRYYDCNSLRTRNQLILYETSNLIEMHTGRVDYCSSWPAFSSGGNSVQGIRNNSTQIFIPNRTPTSPNWTLNQSTPDAYRFTPSGATYTYAAISYSPIPFIVQNQGTYSWYAGTSTTPFASTVCATITPSPSINQYVVKYVGAVGCGATVNSTFFDTVNVHYNIPIATKCLAYCENQLPATWNGLSIPTGSTTNANFGNVVVTGGACDTNFTVNLVNLTVTPNVMPTFTQVPAICSGAALSPLPTTSNNGISGSWLPALNNTTTTTYTFIPNAGQCAANVTMTITVDPNVTPSFTQVAPICAGATLNPLPTISNNGVSGTWSPAMNNSATTTYTFTPSAGQCASNASMTIVVNPIVTASFTQVPGICVGGTLAPLPTTSNNSIAGTWSPAINNTATITYTFTPNVGQCALGTTMTISVNNNLSLTFTQVAPICSGATLAALPTTSSNGIVGTWSPAINNTDNLYVYSFCRTMR